MNWCIISKPFEFELVTTIENIYKTVENAGFPTIFSLSYKSQISPFEQKLVYLENF